MEIALEHWRPPRPPTKEMAEALLQLYERVRFELIRTRRSIEDIIIEEHLEPVHIWAQINKYNHEESAQVDLVPIVQLDIKLQRKMTGEIIDRSDCDFPEPWSREILNSIFPEERAVLAHMMAWDFMEDEVRSMRKIARMFDGAVPEKEKARTMVMKEYGPLLKPLHDSIRDGKL